MNTKLMDAVAEAREALTGRGLGEVDLQVLLALAHAADEAGRAFVGEYEAIIHLTGLPWATVESSLQRLRICGYIAGRSPRAILFGHNPDDQERLILLPRSGPARIHSQDAREIELPPWDAGSPYSDQYTDDDEGAAS
jgi:hypothetical protein